MLLFSYDFVAKNLNQSNSETIDQLQTGDYDFVVEQMTHENVISSFSQHWAEERTGLKPLNKNPEISIDLKDFKIIPESHEALVIDVNTKGNFKGRFKIELSNQSRSLYYDSKELPLDVLNQPIDLRELTWTENPVNESSPKIKTIWSNFEALDGLVIRFYDIKPGDFIIQMIAVNHKPYQLNMKRFNEAETQYSLTNLLRYSDDGLVNSFGYNSVKAKSISDLPVWVLLLAAWITSVFLLYVQNVTAVKPHALTSLVFVMIFILHQDWISAIEHYLQWPLLLFVCWIVFLYRAYLINVQNRASLVWIMTILLAVVLFLFNKKIEFVSTLPMYFLWALVQQILLGPVFSEYFYKKLEYSKWHSAALVGVLFSAIHAPNHVLMIATLVGGVVWSYWWLKYKNIYANALSHALLALLFYQAMPEMLLNSARIGIFF